MRTTFDIIIPASSFNIEKASNLEASILSPSYQLVLIDNLHVDENLKTEFRGLSQTQFNCIRSWLKENKFSFIYIKSEMVEETEHENS